MQFLRFYYWYFWRFSTLHSDCSMVLYRRLQFLHIISNFFQTLDTIIVLIDCIFQTSCRHSKDHWYHSSILFRQIVPTSRSGCSNWLPSSDMLFSFRGRKFELVNCSIFRSPYPNWKVSVTSSVPFKICKLESLDIVQIFEYVSFCEISFKLHTWGYLSMK